MRTQIVKMLNHTLLQNCQILVSTLVTDIRSLYIVGMKVNFVFYEPSGEWNVISNKTFWGIGGEGYDQHGKSQSDAIFAVTAFVLILAVLGFF